MIISGEKENEKLRKTVETGIFEGGTIVSTRQNPTWTSTSHGNRKIIV